MVCDNCWFIVWLFMRYMVTMDLASLTYYPPPVSGLYVFSEQIKYGVIGGCDTDCAYSCCFLPYSCCRQAGGGCY